MPAKISTHVFKGMQKDINVANSSNEYLFDAHNIRFNLLDDNTLMSIVNERGNECILDSGITGLYVSHYVVGNHIVVFTYDETNEVNIIYRIDVNEPNVTVHTLFDESDLNIRPAKPLEFTSYFEANEVVKIYWVDGVNQLRFMNIMEELKNIADPGETPIYRAYTDPNDFNTTPELQLNETVTVELIDGNGLFPAGVVQYALTYVNKLGAESNIFYVTKLHSILYPTRAASPLEYINCAFRITINNVDSGFDYIRCYQLLRTSLDAQPTCLLLNEISINNNDNDVIIIDNNVGSTYDPLSLLFQKYPIVPNTFDLKNNTLFLGNLNEDVFEIGDNNIQTIRDYFNSEGEYTAEELNIINNIPGQGTPGLYRLPLLRFSNFGTNNYVCDDVNYYVYNANADVIRTFKHGEIYRIAVIFQDNYGAWSEPIYLKDLTVDCFQKQQDQYVIPISLIFDASKADSFPEISLSNNRILKRFKFLMVNPTSADRRIYALGILTPTMYEVADRCNNSPYNYSSWYVRPFGGNIECRHNVSIPTRTGLESELLGGDIIPWFESSKTPSQQSTTLLVANFKINVESQLYTTGRGLRGGMYNVGITIYKEGITFDYEPLYERHILFLDSVTYLNEGDYEMLESGRLLLIQKIQQMLQSDSISSLFGYILSQQSNLLDLISLQILRLKHSGNGYIYSFALPFDGTRRSTTITLLLNEIDYQDYILSQDIVSPYKSGNSCCFKVDHSLLNLYSPDINNNYYNIENTNLNLLIVGYSPVDCIKDSVFIQLTNSGASNISSVYNLKNFITKVKTYNKNAKDDVFKDTLVVYDESGEAEQDDGKVKVRRSFTNSRADTNQLLYNYIVYPWHKAGSLNNEDNTERENRSAQYTKIFAKLFVSSNTRYFNTPYKYNSDDKNGNPCSVGILRICNSTNNTIMFKQNDILKTYIPNPDIARTFIKAESETKEPIYVLYEGSMHVIDDAVETKLYEYISNVIYGDTTSEHIADAKSNYPTIETFSDPILIKYNCDTHVVIPINRKIINLNNEDIYSLYKIPSLYDVEYPASEVWGHNSENFPANTKYYPLWDERCYLDYESYIYEDNSVDSERILYDSSYLYVAELYNKDAIYPYGGQIIDYDLLYDILTQNVFIPIMESKPIENLDNGDLIYTTYGDTWYGRWDCLKTLEMTDLDLLSIHDYASVMIESHINLNGRYDSYRNFYDLTLVNALNANKFNDVYNQMDNFWSYKVIPNYLKTTYYPNQITWSLTKLSGALVDEWTRVTAANVEQLDGNKGPINKILNYKDSLFVFQDKCISLIKYNEQTQMTTTEGVSVEISNSQKVAGVVKVYDGTGCVNKWSIASDANGIFFVDNVNECIMWLGGSLDTPIVNLTNSKAFTLFMKANNSFDVWNPEDFSNFVTFIDSAHKDVYFVNADKCLCFSLALLEFTSFYDYLGTFGMFNINNNFYSLYDKNGLKLYRNFTGKYNEIYDELVDTSFTFIDHGESFLTDKTFTNINYIQDAYDVGKVDGLITQGERFKDDYDSVDYSYEKDITFQHLRVWTPFLDTGDIELKHNEDLQRKFRTWGILISRDLKYNNTSVDRIRNNWAKFKFTFTQPDENKDIKIELMNINILSIE